MKGKDTSAISVVKKLPNNVIKSHKKTVHEGEEDSCGDCYYQTGWKEHLKMHNLGCLKLTTQKKFIQSENNHCNAL